MVPWELSKYTGLKDTTMVLISISVDIDIVDIIVYRNYNILRISERYFPSLFSAVFLLYPYYTYDAFC